MVQCGEGNGTRFSSLVTYLWLDDFGDMIPNLAFGSLAVWQDGWKKEGRKERRR